MSTCKSNFLTQIVCIIGVSLALSKRTRNFTSDPTKLVPKSLLVITSGSGCIFISIHRHNQPNLMSEVDFSCVNRLGHIIIIIIIFFFWHLRSCRFRIGKIFNQKNPPRLKLINSVKIYVFLSLLFDLFWILKLG